MRHGGQVVDTLSDGRLVVELAAARGCSRCASGRGCGGALFTAPPAALTLACEPPRMTPRGGAHPRREARIGERVEIEFDAPEGRWLRAALLAYGLPTAGLLGGALVREPWTPFAALAGLLGGILAWRLLVASGLLGALAGPCFATARIASTEHQESR